ncbi:DUF423 domain-containing protein [Metasolibacillus sp.]|uniref:DUF423 domain-containing protein n=1 Tax=Metasolibacillus sp. TaxID=2703680 RepID=UPI0025FBEA45|nr:DUF423 domain-containing protein [Metasolibacillus sp.]MCT6923493.1 DUF423 domain-containing protein [Metasolibacillus sp.]MCT6939785.1 DUF423 domain-containing protein [Metasolibacillus sp.]
MKGSIISGAIHGFLAVALGAFGAHALKGILDDYSTGIWDTAVQYQMFHASALILVGILMSTKIFGEVRQLKIAAICLNLGIVFFSGSLFILAVTGIGILGAITPIGGVLFLTSWVLIIVTTLKKA